MKPDVSDWTIVAAGARADADDDSMAPFTLKPSVQVEAKESIFGSGECGASRRRLKKAEEISSSDAKMRKLIRLSPLHGVLHSKIVCSRQPTLESRARQEPLFEPAPRLKNSHFNAHVLSRFDRSACVLLFIIILVRHQNFASSLILRNVDSSQTT